MNKTLMTMYVLGHFGVDFACAFLLFQMVSTSEQWYLWLLIYNFCAFALQMPLGIFADYFNRNVLCATGGCGMIVLAYLTELTSINYLNGMDMSVLVVVLAGIGNALFHVGGGIDVLNAGKGNAKLLGLFVAPGAFGIYFGTLFGKQDQLAPYTVPLLLSIIAVFLLWAGYIYGKSFRSDNVPFSLEGIHSREIIVGVLCFILVVCIRSYTGMAAHFPWKGQGEWGLVLVCGVVLGKVCGGFFADRFGAKNTSLISLGLSALFYLLSGVPIFGTLAVFLFNMTMPITLWGVAQLLKGAKGFAFGLLTFALYIGFLPIYLNVELVPVNGVTLALTAISSIVLLAISLHKVVDHGG